MSESLLKALSRNRWNLALLFACVLVGSLFLMVGLYQIEIMWIQHAWNWEYFVMPFGWKVPWWFARDVWYTMIIAGFFIAIIGVFISLWYWED